MGNESMLSLLLKAGAIPTGSVAERMVYDACESNSMEMLSTLIETGVDVMSYVEKPPYDRDHLCAIAIRNANFCTCRKPTIVWCISIPEGMTMTVTG